MASRPVALWRSRRMVALLVNRDLRVRYSTSFLGYVWTILDPLLSALVYWFVFTVIFIRKGGESPYIVFLLAGLLPWTWASGAINASCKAMSGEAKLVRSSNVPREVWVVRVVLAKFVEFIFSLPVIVLFAIAFGASLHWQVIYFPLATAIMFLLLTGVALILAPATVLVTDLERVVKIVLRLLLYLSPVLYSVNDVPEQLQGLFMLNPFSGIIDLYRMAFFPNQFVGWTPVITATIISVTTFVIGLFVFRRLERPVLKEI